MKAYKGFDEDLKCRGFKYEVGKTYKMHEGETIKLCSKGFHACGKILDCFAYYPPANSRYCEVDLDGVSHETGDDSKRVGDAITIVRELSLNEVHDISITSEGGDRSSISGGYGSSLSGGDGSSLSGGYESSLRGGDGSSLSGGDGSSLSGGNRSSIRGGDRSSIRGGYGSSIRGGYGSSIRGGNRSSIRGGDGSSIRGGDRSSIRGGDGSSISGGYGSSLSGGYGSSISGGYGSRFCGKKNTVFAVEYFIGNKFAGMRVAIVDGETIKEDVWYDLADDGNWKECGNQKDI